MLVFYNLNIRRPNHKSLIPSIHWTLILSLRDLSPGRSRLDVPFTN